MPQNGFPRTSRLLKHAEFDQVYKHGKRHFSSSMTFFYQLYTAERPGARVGFTVSRAMGQAVTRNRMKRRMRDAVRHHLAELNQRLAEKQMAAEIVINPKKGLLQAEPQAVAAEVAKAFGVIAGVPADKDQ
jgi:ribonuclease P protein component